MLYEGNTYGHPRFEWQLSIQRSQFCVVRKNIQGLKHMSVNKHFELYDCFYYKNSKDEKPS